MIKDYGRKLSNKADSDAEHHIANTIYYAAIAHALVYHNIMITSHSYEDLTKSYGRLSKENWLPDNLLNLFKQSLKYCRAKIE